jgi:hypothetical protein
MDHHPIVLEQRIEPVTVSDLAEVVGPLEQWCVAHRIAQELERTAAHLVA